MYATNSNNRGGHRGGRGGYRGGRGGNRGGHDDQGYMEQGDWGGGFAHNIRSAPMVQQSPGHPPPGHVIVWGYQNLANGQVAIPMLAGGQGNQAFGSQAPSFEAPQGHAQASGNQTDTISRSKLRRLRKQRKRREQRLASESSVQPANISAMAADDDADGSSAIPLVYSGNDPETNTQQSAGAATGRAYSRVHNVEGIAASYLESVRESGQNEMLVYMAPAPKRPNPRKGQPIRSRRIPLHNKCLFSLLVAEVPPESEFSTIVSDMSHPRTFSSDE